MGSFTRALALALNEWLLMLMLFVNSILSYIITRFADYYELQSPCLMCSRLDHILHLKKSHWDMICSKHKSEISSLVKDSCSGSKSDSTRYCSCCNQLWIPRTAEMLPKIGNVRTGKQSTVKKSVSFNHLPHVGYTELKFNSDTESEAVFSEDEGHKFRTVDPVITLPYDLATDKLLNLDLPLVNQNYPEELHLRTNSLRAMEHFEAVSKEKEELIQLQDGSLPSDFKENPANASFMVEAELISFNDVTSITDAPQNPEDVFNGSEFVSLHEVPESFTTNENPADSSLMEETELICFNDVTSTSDATETHEDVSKGIDLMSLHDISLAEVPESLTTIETAVEKSKESPADSSELISFNDVTSTSYAPETHEELSKGIDLMSLHDISLDEVPKSLTTIETTVEKSKENPADSSELISFNGVTSTSDATKTHEDVSKGIDLMYLHDISQEELPKSLTTIETTVEKSKESPADSSELISFNGVTSTSDATKTHEDVSKGIDLLSLHDVSIEEVPQSLITIETTVEKSKESPADSSLVVEETELISLNDVNSTSDPSETHEDISKEIDLMSLHDISLQEVPESFTTNETSVEKSKENPADSSELNSFNDVTSTSDATETHEDVSKEIDLMSLHDISLEELPKSLTTIETTVDKSKEKVTNQVDIAILESEYIVVSPSKSTNYSYSFNSMSVAAETNQHSGELLDLADAYNIIEGNYKDSNEGEQIEQWMKKDTSKVNEDLKTLLTQILSPREIISPKISDQELDNDMQMLLQRKMLERNESNLSLEGVSVSEIEGESESDRLRRQVDHDRKLLTGLYKELEEERSASAIATNQAMAMITRLQEEKAMFQMEALQNLRMMEEQSEYDMEAIQKLNDLLVEREKVIQDLEADIEYFRDQTP